MRHKTLNSKQGFTLLELLVVIAIIMLLASILMPAFSNFRRRAKMLQCTANLNQIGRAGGSFASSNKGAITGTYASPEDSFGSSSTQAGDTTRRIAISTYTIPGWHTEWGGSSGWNTKVQSALTEGTTIMGWYSWPNSPKVHNWCGLDGRVNREMGIGCLYVDKYLTTAASYYCPLNDFGLSPKETGEQFAALNGFCRDHRGGHNGRFTSTGYSYNPHNYRTRNQRRSYRWKNKNSPLPGSLYSASEAVWCMDMLSPNFYTIYKAYNHSQMVDPAEFTEDDVSFNLLHMDGAVSSNVVGPTLLKDSQNGAANLVGATQGFPAWDVYIDEMIFVAKSDQ